MKHLGTCQIETGRLILRRFTLSDAEAMWKNWANDAEVTEFLMWPPHENVDASKKVLAEWVSNYDKDGFYQWAIVPKTLDEPIGSISIVQQRDDIKMVHVGYCIGKKWWHQGYTSEALKALIGFFFTKVGVNRIEARHDPKNPNSGKVMAKCGMKYEGLMRQADHNNKGICDYVMYGMIADEYKASTIDSRCGLHCTNCSWKDRYSCGGCIETNGNPFHGECPVAQCCQDKGFAHCGQCPDIPCDLLTQYSCDPEHGDTPHGARVEQCKKWRELEGK